MFVAYIMSYNFPLCFYIFILKKIYIFLAGARDHVLRGQGLKPHGLVRATNIVALALANRDPDPQHIHTPKTIDQTPPSHLLSSF